MFIFKKKPNTKKYYIWNKEKNIFILPNKSGFLYIDKTKKIKSNSIRKPEKNELIYIKYTIKNKTKLINKKYRKIKNLWQKLNIPPWKRQENPIIYYNNKPIMSPNLFVTKNGKIKNKYYWTIYWKKL